MESEATGKKEIVKYLHILKTKTREDNVMKRTSKMEMWSTISREKVKNTSSQRFYITCYHSQKKKNCTYLTSSIFSDKNVY